MREEAEQQGVDLRRGRSVRALPEEEEWRRPREDDPAQLLAALHPNTLELAQELGKLALYTMGRGATVDDIDVLCGGERETTIWELVDSVLDGDTAKALQALGFLLSRGESVNSLLAQLAAAYRPLATVLDLLEDGKNAEEIGKAIRRPWPRLRDAIRRAQRLGREGVRSAYEILVAADRGMKSGEVRDDLALEVAGHAPAGAGPASQSAALPEPQPLPDGVVAGDGAAVGGGDGGELGRADVAALLRGLAAAGDEGAVPGGLVEVGRGAGEGVELLAGGVEAGAGGEEAVGVRVQGRGEHIHDRACLDQVAAVHDAYVVGDLGDDAEVVRDEEDGGALLAPEGVELVEDLGLDGDVEGGGGFVGDDEVGPEDGGDGDHDALAHAARELEGVGLGDALWVGQADLGEDVDGRDLGFLLSPGEVGGQDLRHLVADGDHGIQAGDGVLEDHGDAPPADLAERRVAHAENVLVVEDDVAAEDIGLVGEELGHGHADGGLAGTGLADEGVNATAFDIERHLVEGVRGAVARSIADGEVSDADEGLHHNEPYGPRRSPGRLAARPD